METDRNCQTQLASDATIAEAMQCSTMTDRLTTNHRQQREVRAGRWTSSSHTIMHTNRLGFHLCQTAAEVAAAEEELEPAMAMAMVATSRSEEAGRQAEEEGAVAGGGVDERAESGSCDAMREPQPQLAFGGASASGRRMGRRMGRRLVGDARRRGWNSNIAHRHRRVGGKNTRITQSVLRDDACISTQLHFNDIGD